MKFMKKVCLIILTVFGPQQLVSMNESKPRKLAKEMPREMQVAVAEKILADVIEYINKNTFPVLQKFDGQNVSNVTFLKNNAQVAIVHQKPNNRHYDYVTVKDLKTKKLLHTSEKFFSDWSVEFSPDGNLYTVNKFFDPVLRMIPESDQGIYLYKTENGNLVKVFNKGVSSDSFFNLDGSLLLTKHGSTTLKVWNVKTGTLVHTFVQDNIGSDFVFTPNNFYLITLSKNVVSIWNLKTGKKDKHFTLKTIGQDGIAALSISPDSSSISPDSSKCMITTLNDNDEAKIEIWDLMRGENIKIFNNVQGKAWGANSKTIFTINNENYKQVLIFDVQTGQQIKKLTYPYSIYDLKLSPNKEMLFLSLKNNNIRVLNSRTGALIGEIHNKEFYNSLPRLKFSQDNSMLITYEFKKAIAGSVIVWRITSGVKELHQWLKFYPSIAQASVIRKIYQAKQSGKKEVELSLNDFEDLVQIPDIVRKSLLEIIGIKLKESQEVQELLKKVTPAQKKQQIREARQKYFEQQNKK